MSISKWQNGSQATQYFQNDLDYYQKNQELGKWQIDGEIAKLFPHLSGSITKESYQDFADLLNHNNKNATGNKRAGFDITFSVSKSISAIYAGADLDTQNQILEAQNKAVERALKRAQQYITYRKRENGERNHHQNNGLAIAKFQHLTNRNEETQLHTHCFIANQTLDAEGNVVSLDNHQLYKNQKLITQIYHQALFQEFQKIGFEMEVADLKKDMYEITGVSKEAREAISTRTAEINKRVEELKADKKFLAKYKDITEAKIRQIATLDTRKSKKSHDYQDIQDIHANNKEIVEDFGLNANYINSLKNRPRQQRETLSADQLIQKSGESLNLKESTFSKEELLSTALKFNATQGFSVSLEDLENSIKNHSEIVQLDDNVYSTKTQIKV